MNQLNRYCDIGFGWTIYALSYHYHCLFLFACLFASLTTSRKLSFFAGLYSSSFFTGSGAGVFLLGLPKPNRSSMGSSVLAPLGFLVITFLSGFEGDSFFSSTFSGFC